MVSVEGGAETIGMSCHTWMHVSLLVANVFICADRNSSSQTIHRLKSTFLGIHPFRHVISIDDRNILLVHFHVSTRCLAMSPP